MVAEMDKEALRDFAKETYGIDLDMKKPVEALRKQVLALGSKQSGEASSEDKPLPEFLLNRSNGFVFEFSKTLFARGDLVPCDKDGNPVV